MIGIFGDHTCVRLPDEIHCRNCAVFRAESRHLLDRPLPEGYQKELTQQLAEPVHLDEDGPLALVLFRVGGAWLALPSGCFSRTLQPLSVSPVPGRQNPVFRGIINAHGDIRLCVTLEPLLGAELRNEVVDASARVFPRMLEIILEGETWVFHADEVLGSIECLSSRINANVDIASGQEGIPVRGEFSWQGLNVMLLAEDLLLHCLREALK